MTDATEAMTRIKEMTECSPAKGCSTITEERRKQMIAARQWQDWYRVGDLDPYRGDGCGHSGASSALRQVLCLLPDALHIPEPWGYKRTEYFAEDELPYANELTKLVGVIADGAFGDRPWERELITELALADSLCPIHFGDYASCFDDDEDECRAIRLIHPSHDT